VLSLLVARGPKQPEKLKLPEKIVVGCLEPLTGAHAVFGTEGRWCINLCLVHFDIKFGAILGSSYHFAG